MVPNSNKPVILIIMDGWGCSTQVEGNAIAQADIPNLKNYSHIYPFTLLGAAGECVGLPFGQMGNSEVGHLNMGAGRIVYQDLTRINRSIESGDFFHNKILIQAMEEVSNKGSSLHLMGLLSDGGVHSHIKQLFALLDMAGRFGHRENVFIHALLDGRDVPPSSGVKYVKELVQYCSESGVGRIASISGRYYTMDRDKRWDRIRKAYEAYVYGRGDLAEDPVDAVLAAYRRGETDEFVTPALIVPSGSSPKTISSEDTLVFFNFRPDRVRQITSSFLEKKIDDLDRGNEPVFPFIVTFTEYDGKFKCPIVFPSEYLKNTLGEWLSLKGYKQLRVAETEKYAHLTFFFNGGQEKPYPLEERYLIPSPKVATYDLQPEMSAPLITERVCEEISRRYYSLIIVNFANADMVGHTGNLAAAIKAVQAVDYGVGLIVDTGLQEGYRILITSDHGNADNMKDPKTGDTITAHTTSKVPLILIDKPSEHNLKNGGILADIAPTVLDLLGLPAPDEMTGSSLLCKK